MNVMLKMAQQKEFPNYQNAESQKDRKADYVGKLSKNLFTAETNLFPVPIVF